MTSLRTWRVVAGSAAVVAAAIAVPVPGEVEDYDGPLDLPQG